MRFFGQRLTFWGLLPLAWLTFLVFPINGFFAEPRSSGQFLLFLSVTTVFIAVFLRTFWGAPHERWAWIGWLVCLAAYFLLSPLMPGGPATAFLIYGASLGGYQAAQRRAMLLALFNVMLMIWPLWTGRWVVQDLSWLGPNLFFAMVAAFGNNAAYRQNLTHRKLAQVQQEKEKLAADAERERIARDLHDLLGHTLSVIVLKSELAAKLTEKDPAKAAQEIREVERISREALQEVRLAVRGYRGSGFGAELARAKVALDAAGVKLIMTDILPELPPDIEASAAMLLREAVTNVVRHAKAKEVNITLIQSAQGHTLTIHDDGIGGDTSEGTGLSSMRERLRAIGGTLDRDGTRGTRLVAFFPDAEGERLKTEGMEAIRV